jgi:hypothetical protein
MPSITLGAMVEPSQTHGDPVSGPYNRRAPHGTEHQSQKENGEQYARLTAENATAAAERGGSGAGHNLDHIHDMPHPDC